MERRTFLQLPVYAGAASAAAPPSGDPVYKVVTPYKPSANPGMPGPFAGHVVRMHSEKVIDSNTDQIDAALLREMISRGMRTLTGEKTDADAWRRFFTPADVIGIKLNCSGAPRICSRPEVIAEIVRNLVAVDVPAKNIWLYERFPEQVDTVGYPKYLPDGVHIHSVETSRNSIRNYDPKTYVEVNFFGEDDTRSNLVRLVGEQFTKIINVPNMKDHGASGVTGCLKNIAYGSFSNVARSHYREKTNTKTFIGTLASTEPLRSKTVLQIMDGLRGVWHGGPFSRFPQFRFYPRQIVVGTDPVAIDRLLIDVIEAKRKAQGAISVFDRSMSHIRSDDSGQQDPNVFRYIREPGHIEYAAGLGLGVFDKTKIALKEFEL